jgi:CRISPR-associated exonuclease Cas4
MLYLAIALFIFAFFFFRTSARQRQEAGLPGGRVIYTDTRVWKTSVTPLYDGVLGLTGKPDYLIEQSDGNIIPVEVKSGKAPEAPYDSHIYQLAAYCLLVERKYNKRPPYGVIHYEDRDFAIDYTRELEMSLLDLLAEMKRDDFKEEVDRSHEQPGRCAKCGYREVCEQSLV